MAKFEDLLVNLHGEHKELAELTRESWSNMMSWASLKSLVKFRLEILTYVSILRDKDQRQVRKHVKKIREYMAEIHEVSQVELNSSNYIKNILTPIKEAREDFKAYKEGSLAKVVSKKAQKAIEKASKKEGETAVDRIADLARRAA